MEEFLVERVNAQIGVFWVWNNEIIGYPIPWETLKPDSLGFVNPPKDHQTIWEADVIKRYPQLRDKEFFEVPRGRIVYNVRDAKFRLISSKLITGNKPLLNKICRYFHIPPPSLVVIQDQHYEIIPQDVDIFDDGD